MGDSEKEVLDKNNIENITVDELNIKTAKAVKGRGKSDKVGFWASMKTEFGKIIWPSRQSLGKQTVAVIVSTVVLGAIIFGIDVGITALFDAIFVG